MKTKLLAALFAATLSCYAIHSNAQHNARAGANALHTIVAAGGGLGDYNGAFGYDAMYYTNLGSYNTASGYRSLYLNVNGSYNTANGYQSLYKNVDSNYNTAVGYNCLYNNTASNNTAMGWSSMFNNATGTYNTAIGNSVMYYNITGSYNTAVGRRSLFSNTTGSENTANGFDVLYKNTTGIQNSALGVYALYNNQTGSYNTAGGYSSLFNNTGGVQEDGSKNTAYGFESLYKNTTGECNTAVGHLALYTNIIGDHNTAIGCGADVAFNNLINATALGANAIAQASNSTAIGANAVVVAPNTIWMGDAFLAGTFCNAGMYLVSDGRFKKNIKENVPGLQFIKALKPLTYNYDIHSINEHKGVKENLQESADNANEKAIAKKEQMVYSGFIAQEVEKAAKELGYDFSGVYIPQNDKDVYALNYSDFVVPLVKAVQELSKQNDDLKARLEKLEQANAQLSSASSAQSSQAIAVTNASLEQNIPNPLTNSTVIRYNIPAAFKTAQIIITDFSGKTIKQVTINTKGAGTLNVDASLLSNGAYSYSLIVDGKIISSKKMIVAK